MLALLSIGVAGAATAQTRPWTVKAGVGHVSPQVKSGELSPPALPRSQADLSGDTRPVFSLGYRLGERLALSLDAGLPFWLDVSGAGAVAGTGKLASVRAMAPTLFLQ